MIATPQEVLDFWFVECEPADWFKKSEEFDNEIRSRFLETYEAIVNGETADWRRSAKGRLAEIIVLDQFSRNMFRDCLLYTSYSGLFMAGFIILWES